MLLIGPVLASSHTASERPTMTQLKQRGPGVGLIAGTGDPQRRYHRQLGLRVRKQLLGGLGLLLHPNSLQHFQPLGRWSSTQGAGPEGAHQVWELTVMVGVLGLSLGQSVGSTVTPKDRRTPAKHLTAQGQEAPGPSSTYLSWTSGAAWPSWAPVTTHGEGDPVLRVPPCCVHGTPWQPTLGLSVPWTQDPLLIPLHSLSFPGSRVPKVHRKLGG